jgi:drug/metabolite transporter (DMT)-like permease
MPLWLLPLLAAAFYAGEMVITDNRLTKMSPVVLTFLTSLGMTVFTLCLMVYDHSYWAQIKTATTHEWYGIGLLVLACCLGALCHYGSLHKDTGATMLALFYVLLPVFAAAMKFEKPTPKMIFAWILAGVSCYIASTILSEASTTEEKEPKIVAKP